MDRTLMGAQSLKIFVNTHKEHPLQRRLSIIRQVGKNDVLCTGQSASFTSHILSGPICKVVTVARMELIHGLNNMDQPSYY